MLRVRVWARAVRRRPRAAAAIAALALAALAAGARLLAPPDLRADTDFPRVRADRLAHLLADISAHTLTVPGSWTLEEEASNHTSWRYTASYACGARCVGRAAVEAHETHAAPAPAQHRVRVVHQRCASPPLLPWPLLCDEMETESVVTSVTREGGVGGARLQQRWRARCGAAAALLARCGARDLRRAADTLLLRLRDRLQGSDHLLLHSKWS